MFSSRRSNSGFKTFIIVLLVLITFGAGFYAYNYGYSRLRAPLVPNAIQTRNNILEPNVAMLSLNTNNFSQVGLSSPSPSGSTIQVSKSAIPGVVGIAVARLDGDTLFDGSTQRIGLGSGAIITSDGIILSNNHVAGSRNTKCMVTLSDGRNIEGTTIWSDPVIDLALVKVNLNNLSQIPLGDASTLQVGEQAIAIGNPLGLEFQRTVTSGIISALNRTIKIQNDHGTNYMEDLIQTDASINPGNSGGPLLNSRGELVGINTIKVQSAEGMGFAIPVNAVIPILKKVIDNGDIRETYIGLFAYDKEVTRYLNNDMKIEKGVYVSTVDEDGPAYKSGIRVGNIITNIDGKDINTMLQLRTHIHSKLPGDTIKVTQIANGRMETINVILNNKDKDGLITR